MEDWRGKFIIDFHNYYKLLNIPDCVRYMVCIFKVGTKSQFLLLTQTEKMSTPVLNKDNLQYYLN